MSIKLFVTGTDTDAGKTYVTSGILTAFKKQKYSTLGIKPIASGSILHEGILKNSDALTLQEASSIKLHYHHINPIAFEPAIAPHIAANQQGRTITVHELKQQTQYALQYPADICLVEGAGGWYVPLNDKETLADYVKAVDLKVLLVVGMRLGCINHAILTYKAIVHDKIPIVGWIANCIDPTMQALQENLTTLKKWLHVPCLGVISYQQEIFNTLSLLSAR